MGCACSSTNRRQPQLPTVTDFKITIQKFQQHANLQKQKLTNEGLDLERQLNQMINNTVRDKDQEQQLFSKLTQKVKYLEAIDLIILNCSILLDQINAIVRSQGQIQPVQHLMIYIESIIYASDKMNLKESQDFQNKFLFYFKLDQNNLTKVSQEIINLLQNPFPTPSEINNYVKKFAQKYKLSQQQINLIGNQFQFEDQDFQLDNPPNPQIQDQSLINQPPQLMNQQMQQNNNNFQNNQRDAYYIQQDQQGNEYISSNPYNRIGLNQQNHGFEVPQHLQPQKPNIKGILDQKYKKK